MRFDLADLILLLNTVETGSITGGAERTHRTLASASARIRGMEESLGMQLLIRGQRGVEATAVGRTVVRHARIALRQHERLRAELGEYARGVKGHIRMMSNTASITEHLPQSLAEFLSAHPMVNVNLEERSSYDIVSALREGTIDIGILADSVDMSYLDVFPFREDKLMLVTSCDHELSEVENVKFSEALKYEFVGLQEGSALQEFLTDQAARMGMRFQYRVRLPSAEAVCRMVERKVGIAILPIATATRLTQVSAIRMAELDESWASRKLLICTQSFADLPSYAQHLVNHLRDDVAHGLDPGQS